MAEQSTPLTLTDFAYFGRQTIKFGGIAIVALMVGRMMFSAFWAYWRAVNPPPPPPPTVGFGILPSIQFPQVDDADKPTSYQLETPTGQLPSFGNRVKVFLKIRSAPGLLNDQEAKQIAADLGFVFSPQVIGATTYRFTKSQPIEAVLEIDSVSKDFTITSDFSNRPELLADNQLPDQLQAAAQLRTLLSSNQLLPRDMATASAEVQYLKVTAGGTEPALSISDADVLELSLRRQPIDGQFEIYTPGNNKGNVYGLMIGSLNGINSMVALDYHYQPVDYSFVETYPLRSAQVAWRLLQAGEGYIAQKGEFDTATVRRVTLGYYDSFTEEDYLQPIYVFEGDGGFLGYVPAIDAQYLQSPSNVENQ